MQHAVTRLAERQYGLVSLGQLRDSMSRSALRNLIDKDCLERIHRGVFKVQGSPRSWEQRVMAAVLASPLGTLASHLTAGRLWGLPGCTDARIEVTVPYGRSRRTNVCWAHTTTAPDPRPGRLADIPLTSIERTLVDLSSRLSYSSLERAVDQAIWMKLTTADAVDTELVRVGTMGRARTRALQHILEPRCSREIEVDSALHQRVVDWLLDMGYDDFVVEYPIKVGSRQRYLDIAWPEKKLAIETDGFEFHSSRRSFDDDRRRNNGLSIMGWKVLHVTSRTTRSELARLLREV